MTMAGITTDAMLCGASFAASGALNKGKRPAPTPNSTTSLMQLT